MLTTLRRKAGIYAAFAAAVPKTFLAYRIWVWMEMVVQVIWLIVMSAFWHAVYMGQGTIGGLGITQTLNYILLAQAFLPLLNGDAIFYFGHMVREGEVVIELLRPIDFQGRRYAEALAGMATTLALKIPLLAVAVLFFGLRLPTNPLVWGAFLVAMLLGHAVLFCFDWIFGCLAFYSTETWGLSVLREGMAIFFSGALVPLALMPGWLQRIAGALPFAQALYAPLAILSEITPLSDVWRVWLGQLAWLIVLLSLSRAIFARTVRRVTVQGG
jgi:ABC-2 type transport system permease protein